MLVRRKWTGVGVIGAVALGAAMFIGGCAETNGVDVYNATDQVVKVEMLSHDATGAMSVYSTAIINRGATFTNRMEEPVRGQALRARFMLEHETQADENWVMLNLPGKSTRFYQLELVDGRLKAVAQKRGRPEAQTSPAQ